MRQITVCCMAWLLLGLSACSSQEKAPDAKKPEAEKAEAKPDEAGKNMSDQNLETITLGGGCFWCVEAVYKHVDGVKSITSGYAGGKTENPTYKQICNGDTGHAEVIQVAYDPAQVKLEKILSVFFQAHDPTTLNRQGNDVGTQYRSTVMYHNAAQKAAAEKMIKDLNEAKVYDKPIVTTLEEMKKFYPAEEYHQNYYALNPNQPYCRAVIQPKLAKFLKQYQAEKEKEKAQDK